MSMNNKPHMRQILLREAFFRFPSTQGRQNGRAGAKKNVSRKETQRRAVDDQKWSKIARARNTIITPLKRTGGLKGTKKASLSKIWRICGLLFMDMTM